MRSNRRLPGLLIVAGLAVVLAVAAAPAAATPNAQSTNETVEVTTLQPDPGETDAYLGGNLTDLDAVDGAVASVQYREAGADEWRRSETVEEFQSPSRFYLHVEGLAEATTYEYRARAASWNGNASDVGDVVTFSTYDAPEIATGQPVTVTEDAATVVANLTDLGAGGTGTVQLQYRAVDSSGWYDVGDEQPAEQVGGYRLSLDDLEPSTTYEYRAVVIGADGFSDYADSRTLRTDEPATVRTGDADVDGTVATLRGEVVELGNASGGTAHVAYRRSGEAKWNRTGRTKAAEPTTYSATAEDLVPGATYEYRAVLQTADGDHDRGEVRTFTVDAGDPSVATTGVRSVTADDATLQGDLRDLGSADGAAVGFQYRERGADAWTNASSGNRSATGTFARTVDGLAPGTTYEFRADATAFDGDVDAGEVDTFTTPTEPAVETGDATEVAVDAATLRGSLADLGGADAVDVAVEYRARGDDAWQRVDVGTLDATGAFRTAVDGLRQETAYEYRAVGVAADGTVATGTVATFATPARASPPSIDALSGTEDSPPNPHAELDVSWTVSDDDADLARASLAVTDASGRVVERRSVDLAGADADGALHTRVKHGAGERYDVSLVVVDADGNEATATARIAA